MDIIGTLDANKELIAEVVFVLLTLTVANRKTKAWDKRVTLIGKIFWLVVDRLALARTKEAEKLFKLPLQDGRE